MRRRIVADAPQQDIEIGAHQPGGVAERAPLVAEDREGRLVVGQRLVVLAGGGLRAGELDQELGQRQGIGILLLEGVDGGLQLRGRLRGGAHVAVQPQHIGLHACVQPRRCRAEGEDGRRAPAAGLSDGGGLGAALVEDGPVQDRHRTLQHLARLVVAAEHFI